MHSFYRRHAHDSDSKDDLPLTGSPLLDLVIPITIAPPAHDAMVHAEDIMRDSCESYPSDCESMWDSSRSLTDMALTSSTSLADVLASQRSTFQDMQTQQPLSSTATIESSMRLLESMTVDDVSAFLDDSSTIVLPPSQTSILVEDDPQKSRQAQSRWAQQVRLKTARFLFEQTQAAKAKVSKMATATAPPAPHDASTSPADSSPSAETPSTLQKWNRWLTDHYNSNVKPGSHHAILGRKGGLHMLPNPLVALWSREDPHASNAVDPLGLVALEEVVQTPKMMRYYASWLPTEPDKCKLFFLCSLDEYRLFWRTLASQSSTTVLSDESRSRLQTYGRKIFAKYLVSTSPFFIGHDDDGTAAAVDAAISAGGEGALHAFDGISVLVKQHLMASYPTFRATDLYKDMLASCRRELLPLDCVLLNRLFCHFFWLFLFQHQYHNELALYMDVQYNFKFVCRDWHRGIRAHDDGDDDDEHVMHVQGQCVTALHYLRRRFIASHAYAGFVLYEQHSPHELSELLLHYGLRAHSLPSGHCRVDPPILDDVPIDWLEAIVYFESIPTAPTTLELKWTPHFGASTLAGATGLDAFLVPWCKDIPTECRIKSSHCPSPFAFNTHMLVGEVELFVAVMTLFRPKQDDPTSYLPYGVAVYSRYPLHTTLRQRVSDVYEACMMSGGFGSSMLSTLTAPLRTAGWRHLPDRLPGIDFSLSLLFDTLDVANIITLFTAALVECRLLLISSQLTVLAVVAESLRTILHPLKWPHVYLPVLPGKLLGYLQCPTPFIVGVQKDLLDAEVLSTTLRQCVKLHVTKSDHVFSHSFERQPREFPQRRVRLAFHDAVLAVIGSEDVATSKGGVEDVHFGRFRYLWDDQYQDKMVFFDEAGYLASSPVVMRPFRTCLIATQAFSEYIVDHNGFTDDEASN
ncbi:hypothetical protein B5M09_009749 [Aphanomyces astaci]|uniref:UDENN domain-containing protein n=1 Tax=Aphanomyces astaci TaxID=112090 RepID=A0A3R7WT09_APHAT|nr:hypothetical protein B5M09_009749 [Aphanomyces astaci]